MMLEIIEVLGAEFPQIDPSVRMAVQPEKRQIGFCL
jgi:hypothetical protein